MDSHLSTCIMANTRVPYNQRNFSRAELFCICIPNGFQKKSQELYFFISICSISSCRCTTERSQKYGFGRNFLLQPMLQANCFLLINTYTILHTAVIWATHHLPQVDHYIISPIECSRPILIFLISSVLWSNMKLALMKLLSQTQIIQKCKWTYH